MCNRREMHRERSGEETWKKENTWNANRPPRQKYIKVPKLVKRFLSIYGKRSLLPRP